MRAWSHRRTAACLAAVLSCTPACAARLRDPLARPSVIDARERRVRTLQADLAGIFAAAALEHGIVAVHVGSIDRHDVLFRYNADRLVMPASNMKIPTLAAAAERLGWDYTFHTTLAATGPVVEGTLLGDLVVRGSGDPSLNARQVEPVRVLDGWADLLAAHGIRRIAGRLVGDDNAFDEQSFGHGWSWEDLHDGYSAPISALQVYEDAVTVSIAPGSSPGTPADAAFATPGSGWAIDNRAVTGEPGTPVTIAARRIPGAFLVTLTGSIPSGSTVITRALAVDNPTTYLLRLFAAALERRGITIARGVADIDDLPAGSVSPEGTPLVQDPLAPAPGNRPAPDESKSEPVWGDAAPSRRPRRRTCRNCRRRQSCRVRRVEGLGRSCGQSRHGRRLRAVALQLCNR